MKNRSSNILGFREIDKTMLAKVGGKGANLGELTKIEGINVPEGFCISTEAFIRITLFPYTTLFRSRKSVV